MEAFHQTFAHAHEYRERHDAHDGYDHDERNQHPRSSGYVIFFVICSRNPLHNALKYSSLDAGVGVGESLGG